MAKYLLLNKILFDGVDLKAAKEIDDKVYSIAKIVASGGILIPLPNPIVEARAAEVRKEQARGRRGAELDDLTSAFAEFVDGGSINPLEHAKLRQLVHLADGQGGPWEGFLSGAYRETLPTPTQGSIEAYLRVTDPGAPVGDHIFSIGADSSLF